MYLWKSIFDSASPISSCLFTMADSNRFSDILKNCSFFDILTTTAGKTSTTLEMLFLPMITTISGLMGTCRAHTHRDIAFSEPNVIWSCVAAPPGKLIILLLVRLRMILLLQKHFH